MGYTYTKMLIIVDLHLNLPIILYFYLINLENLALSQICISNVGSGENVGPVVHSPSEEVRQMVSIQFVALNFFTWWE